MKRLLAAVSTALLVHLALLAPARALAATRTEGKGQIPADFTLTTQDGKPFTLSKDAAGRAVALTFIFSRCPGACPLVVEACVSAARKAGAGRNPKGPLVVAVSFDPENDTPAKLKAYAQERGLSPRQALFLTGPAATVRKVMGDYGVKAEKSGASFDHNFITVVIGKDGTLVSRWEGSTLDEARLAADLKAGAGGVPRTAGKP